MESKRVLLLPGISRTEPWVPNFKVCGARQACASGEAWLVDQANSRSAPAAPTLALGLTWGCAITDAVGSYVRVQLPAQGGQLLQLRQAEGLRRINW